MDFVQIWQTTTTQTWEKDDLKSILVDTQYFVEILDEEQLF